MHPDYIENEHVEMKSPSKVLQANIDLLSSRERVGLGKYGTTLDRKDLSHEQFLQHGLEEALDLGMYLQAALQHIRDTNAGYDSLRKSLDQFINDYDRNGQSGRHDREYYFGREEAYEALKELVHQHDVEMVRRKLK